MTVSLCKKFRATRRMHGTIVCHLGARGALRRVVTIPDRMMRQLKQSYLGRLRELSVGL